MLLGNQILVVDDTPAALKATVRILQSAGYDVAQALDGAEALRQIRALRPRLVLLDVVLPDISGMEVLRQIRTDSDLSDIAIVLLSAQQTRPDQQAGGLDAGADGYIARPIASQELLARVRSFLRQRELLEQLRASEARFRDLITRQHDGLLVVSRAGIIQFINPAVERLAGRPARELVGTRFDFPLGEPEPREIQWPRPHGPAITAQMHCGSLAWHDQPAWLVTLRDITREVRLEAQCRQSQKMAAVGRLAAGVAHDFNNLLGVILMQSELLATTHPLSATQSQHVSEINTAVDRGAALTRQLLLFSRNKQIKLRDLELGDSINATLKMLRCLLGETIEVQLQLAPQPVFVQADATMLDQVLMNLAVNAREAMPGGGRLQLEMSTVELDPLAAAQSALARPGSFVCLAVRDSGCGIPPETLPRIFEPFFTTREVGKGSGLGLATVFGIVEQHRGWITVNSEVGQGTTFRVFLPRVANPGPLAPVAVANPATPAGTETILLVEDDAALRAALEKSLLQLGYRTVIAVSGAAALARWPEHRAGIHLLLTDMLMPGGLTGHDLAQRLQTDRPELKVLYMSGYYARPPGGDGGLVEGVNLLAKPFTMPQLAQTIRALLDGRVAVSPTAKLPPTAND